MKKLIYLFSLSFVFLSFGCNKDGIKPKNEIFIRVKNTSLIDYLNVSIYSGISFKETETKQVTLVKSGSFSDYVDFESAIDPVGYHIKLTENVSTGTTYFSPNNTKRLEKGKYTLELYVPIRGPFNVEAKLIKEN